MASKFLTTAAASGNNTDAMQKALETLARFVLKTVARQYPLLSGIATLANSRPFVWPTRADDLVETRLRDGSSLFVHLNDFVGRTAYYFGDLDPKLSTLCKSVLRPGDLMLDIGGNYGLVTVLAARLVGPSGAVHAFEPQPDLAKLIKRSAEHNGYRQIVVHDVGLSNADQELTITVPHGNRGAASVTHKLQGATSTVRLRQGTQCLAEALAGRRPRLVKIDVEGHESEVLQGAADWLEDAGPEVIIFEHNSPTPMWDLSGVQLLLRLGYTFYGVPKARLRLRLSPLSRGSATWPRFHDIVAVHPNSDWSPPT